MRISREKLETALGGVNFAAAAFAALMLIACAPTPRVIRPATGPAYVTPLGNQRRAAFEHEMIPVAPVVAWDVNAGAGTRGSLLLVDSAVLTATTNRMLLAFHTESGERYWEQRFGGAVSSMPLFDGTQLYVGTTQYEGALFALELGRGRRVWKQSIGPIRFAPLLDRGVVYAGTDGGIVTALRAQDGTRIWRADLRSSISESLLDAGDRVIAFTQNDSVVALRKSDGVIVARSSSAGTPSAAPAMDGTTIIVPVQPNWVLGIDAHSLATLWRVPADAPVLTAPAITAGGAYIASRSGSLYRITGGQLEKIGELGHPISSSLTLTRDHLLLGSYDGTLLAVKYDGTVSWTHKFNDSIVAPVAVRGQAVYVPLLRGRIVKLR